MSDYKKLDPAIRAQALVGRFLQGWAAMEIALHNAIGAALAQGQGLQSSIAGIGGGTLSQIIATIVLLFLVLLPLFIFGALGEVMGQRALLRVFFVELGPARTLFPDVATKGIQ